MTHTNESPEYPGRFRKTKPFEEVKLGLETGHQVKLSGFGNFLTRSKAERPGRNPKTGQRTGLSAATIVTLKDVEPSNLIQNCFSILTGE